MITAHADVVGSLLRPPWLLEAQERLRAVSWSFCHLAPGNAAR